MPDRTDRPAGLLRFVGRAAELDLFSSWLTAGSFSVLWVYGPGGIGKSTLLRAFAETERNAGYLLAQIDGARVMPTPDGIRAAVWEALSQGNDANLGLAYGAAPAKPSVIVLDVAASVKQALRSLHQPQALLRNPLMASSMVQNELHEHSDYRPDQVLRGLIVNAAQVVKADPRAEAQYRALDRTYLHPAPSQHKAAELLDLPFSTYRRYRYRGIEAITSGCGTATLIMRHAASHLLGG